ELEIRGTGLQGTHTVWLGPGSKLEAAKSDSTSQVAFPYTKGPDGLNAQVKGTPDGSRASVRLMMAPDARVGFHNLSLISAGGLSGPIPFWVGPHAVIQETATPHNTPGTAQPVKLPVAIQGRLTQTGQLGYYRFEIAQKQTFAFEVIALHGAGFDPQIALY